MLSRLAIYVLILCTSTSSYAQQKPVVDYPKEVQPFFVKYCNGCHSVDAMEAGIRTDHSGVDGVFIEDRKNWLKVYDMMRFKAMPPEEADQPSNAERDLSLIHI